jgi:hypothetical protein
MIKAIVKNLSGPGKVLNCIELPDNWTGAKGEWESPARTRIMDALDCSPGDTWDGTNFIRPTPPTPPTDEEQFVEWLAKNQFAKALVRANNLPKTNPDHLEPNTGLSDADIVTKIAANSEAMRDE